MEKCCHCDMLVKALDQRVDQRLIDLEKRLDERYINQKDYNVQHNSLQREMKEQGKETVTIIRFDEFRDNANERFGKLERWPWLFGIVFVVIQLLIKWLGS